MQNSFHTDLLKMRSSNHSMKKKAKIITACTAAVLAAGGAAAAVLHTLGNREPEAPVLTEPATMAPVTEAPTEPPTEKVYDYVEEPHGITGLGNSLLRVNKDTVGWLKIPGTNVDYPFTRDPGEIPAGEPYYGGEAYNSNYYYLDHDLDGSYKRAGTLFCDWRDNLTPVEWLQSENLVIYGHNMMNDTMFGSLRRYRQDYSYWQRAPFVELDTLYGHYDYVIFAGIITGGNWYSDFIYWDMEELDDESQFNYYMDCVRNKQLFNTGADVQYGDKIMTLSTCYSDEDNSRFLVLARRLRPGEVYGDLSTIKATDAYKTAHPEEYPTEKPAEQPTEETQD